MKKRLIALVLVLVCTMSLFAGCKSSGQEADSTVPETVSNVVTTEAAAGTTAVSTIPVTQSTETDAATTEAVQTQASTEEAATQPPVTQPPVTQPPVTQPPVTQPPATQPPVTQPPVTQPPATQPPVTQPPATETLSTEQMKALAESLIGQPVSALYAAIGYPTGGSSYETSCNAPAGTEAEDGQLYYNGFTVYTYRQDGKEVVVDVW